MSQHTAPGRDDDASIPATVSVFGPDFPFDYERWLQDPAGLGQIPAERHGTRVAIIGAGMAGLVAGYELMRLGLHPVFYEAGELGGRLRTRRFTGSDGPVAELGAMRFPPSSSAFWHYADKLGLKTQPFPNPLTEAAGSTVIELEGEKHYARSTADLPLLFREVEDAYNRALEEEAGFAALRAAIAARDAERIKALWNPLVEAWDERTFYDFVTTSRAFRGLSFRHREVFGQVGFGTGGWDSDFPNSMLEILRVAVTEQDVDQHAILSGADQVPYGIWRRPPDRLAHWPQGTTLAALNGGAPRPGCTRLQREGERIAVTDRWGRTESFEAVIATCQSWLLTTSIDTEERLIPNKLWMALDRTRYMQSAKTFVMVDRPFWRDRGADGRDAMSMTLTDRLTRGTYLFETAPDEPGVICLSYTWMTDALKMLPLPVERRVELALDALGKVYPGLDITGHIVGDPITVSWEADPNFLGAFKGALPGHYRYNHRMFGHFMQDALPPDERGFFIAGDDVSFIPGWVEGAVQTGLNAMWGVMHQFGGSTAPGNPGPGDRYPDLGPVALPD
ncbi:MAG: NAD(P)/FAD-dependent oxidoreductase [Pseudomonadota bacterium]